MCQSLLKNRKDSFFENEMKSYDQGRGIFKDYKEYRTITVLINWKEVPSVLLVLSTHMH